MATERLPVDKLYRLQMQKKKKLWTKFDCKEK